MSNNYSDEIISVVYSKVDGPGSAYQALSLFTSYGPIDETSLEEVYLGLSSRAPRVCEDGEIADFQDIEMLQKYSFELSQKLYAKGASLISIDEYNQILLESYSCEELVQKLQESGNFLANPDAGKSNFFNKIFN